MREAAGDALGSIAEPLFCQSSVLTVGDPAHNPMLRAAYEVMHEQKKELQQAGAHAFYKVMSGKSEQTTAGLSSESMTTHGNCHPTSSLPVQKDYISNYA